ncbi:Damaged DNA binding protein [Entamoeba marina]
MSTIAPSSAITHSLTANLDGSISKYLVLVKNTIIEVYKLTSTGLDRIYTKTFPYSISILLKYRPNNSPTQDHLIIVTSNQQLLIAKLDGLKMNVIFTTSVEDRLGRIAFYGSSGVVSSNNQFLLLHLYNHLIKIIHLPQGNEDIFNANPTNVKMDEQRILGLYSCILGDVELFAFHHENKTEQRNVTFYSFNQDVLTLTPFQLPLNNPTLLFIPHPKGFGFICITPQSIVYYTKSSSSTSVAIPPISTETYCFISDDRLLLMDSEGKMHLVTIIQNGDQTEMHYYPLPFNPLSIPTTVSYLDNSVLLWGSSGGDSYLLKITEEACEILEVFENRGPILDMTAIHDKVTNKDDLLLCCNTYQQGTLKLISSGVGINTIVEIPYEGINGLYTVNANTTQYIIVSLEEETKVLQMRWLNGSAEMNEIKTSGFINVPTMCCGLISASEMNDLIITQVHPQGIVLVSINDLSQISTFTTNSYITHASIIGETLYFTSGKELFQFDTIKNTQILLHSFENEISAFSIVQNENESLLAVSFWNYNVVQIYSIPTFEIKNQYVIEGPIYAKSIQLVQDQHGVYLVTGIGDGRVCIYYIPKENSMDIEGEPITNTTKILEIGIAPISLQKMFLNNQEYLICLCDRPTLLSFEDSKIKSLSVNIPEALSILPLEIPQIPNSLMVATKDKLLIGNIEEVQMIHTKSLSLNVFVSKIAVSSISHYAMMLTSEFKTVTNGKMESHSVRLIDLRKMEIVDILELEENEHSMSIERFETNGDEMFIVGTAYSRPNEVEPTMGRLLVIQNVGNKLMVVLTKTVNGAVYSLKMYMGEYIAASIEKKLYIMKYERTIENEVFVSSLNEKASTSVKLIGLYIKTLNDLILLGDLMKSISVYTFKPNTNNIVEISRDFYASYTTAVEFVNNECYTSADSNGNILIFNSNTATQNESERFRLQNCAHVHVGDCINVFCKGSIAPLHQTLSDIQKNCILFGGITGYIGGITEIPKEMYETLYTMQKLLLTEMKGLVECPTPTNWRMVIDDWKRLPITNVIDGSIVESFIDLPKETSLRIAKECGKSVTELTQLLENLNNIFH